MSDSDLMNKYNEFMAWVSYSKAELVQAEIAEEQSAFELRIAESKGLIGQWDAESKGDRVTLAKARRDVDPAVVEKNADHLQARAYRKLVESVFERCDRGAQVLSRELSRRIGISNKDRYSSRTSA